MILIAMVTTSAVFVVAMLLGSCIKKPEEDMQVNSNCTSAVSREECCMHTNIMSAHVL